MKKYPWQIDEPEKPKHDRNVPPPPWYKHNPAFRPISDLTDDYSAELLRKTLIEGYAPTVCT